MLLKFFGLLCMLLMSAFAHSQTCPDVKAPSQLNPHDVASVSQLKQNFLSYAPNVRLRPERNSLLMDFAFANQQYVIDTFFSKYCGLIAEEKFQLSIEEQTVKLTNASDELYFRVPFPPPVIDSRNNISQSPRLDNHQEQGMFAYASYGPPMNEEPLSIDPDVSMSEGEAKANTWLKAPPYVVTEANKYFVIVSSVRTFEQAVQEVRRLKRRAPELDYVVYGPYQDNPNHAIMVATWLNRADAEFALEQTRAVLRMDARLWRCPREGEQC